MSNSGGLDLEGGRVCVLGYLMFEAGRGECE